MTTKLENADREQIRFGEFLERINNARGTEPLAKWVKQACKQRLDRESN